MRSKRVRQINPAARPEIASAWTTLGDTGAEVCADSQSRHPASGRGDAAEFAQGIRRRADHHGLQGALLGRARPQPGPRAAASAHRPGQGRRVGHGLYELGKIALQYIRQLPPITKGGPDFSKLTDDLKAELTDDRISVTMDVQKASKWATAITAPIRGTAARSRCVNNLKQIGLAMHNYHAMHKSFPPAYTVDKSGKPLLSWRVLILPFLEQDALYKEFHLDEPWDSAHNRALIERMPETYRCPVMSSKLRQHRQDDLSDPRGKTTIFPGSEGVKIQKITDGTSNTIFVVDACGRARRGLDPAGRPERRAKTGCESNLRPSSRWRELWFRRRLGPLHQGDRGPQAP